MENMRRVVMGAKIVFQIDREKKSNKFCSEYTSG